jgi:DNA-directed RNA polymerase
MNFLFHKNTIGAMCFDRESKKWRWKVLANAGDPNDGAKSQFRIDMETAQELLGRPFYVPMNFDTRGRVPVPAPERLRSFAARTLNDAGKST